MKVALINPHPSNYPPFGLVTIAASLMQQGHKVILFEDMFRVPTNVDLIGFGGYTLWLNEMQDLIEVLPKDIPSVVGGPCITSNPETFHSLNVDYGVVGEGEETLCELANNLEEGNSPTKVKGLLIKQRKSFQRRSFMELSDKTIPAWNLLTRNYSAGLGVETSRGCPFNCVFCNAPLISGRKWRSRSIEDIVSEILFLNDKYHPEKIYFADDNCTVDPKRWKHLCLALAEADLDIKFHVPEGIQAHHLDMETLLLMKQAGFKHITIGAESGCNRVLKEVIDKGGLTTSQVERVVRNCVKIGLKVSCFFVIGILGETYEEMQQTLAFARHLRRLGAESCSIRNCLPVPGTRLWKTAKKENSLLISEKEAQNHELLHSGKHFLTSQDWKPQQVEELAKQGQRENSQHLWRKNFVRQAFRKIKEVGKI